MTFASRKTCHVLLIAGAAVLVTGLCSCNTILGGGTRVYSYSSGEIIECQQTSRALAKSIRVVETHRDRVNGLLRVQIDGLNLTKQALQFEYQFVWFISGVSGDTRMEEKTVMSAWDDIFVVAKDICHMTGIAPNDRVTDFKFIVRFPDRI